MANIRILDDATVNQIAAGEVVERPASVVKELVENAVDAGATRIDIEIRNGGRTLIRVSDNGAGMDRDDLVLAVERHATSKIAAAEDLYCLSTLGFRGEALPSIGAVAALDITSRVRGQAECYTLEMRGGLVKRVYESGGPEGTTVLVADLFGNVPARLKYLKSIPTEAGYITDIVGRTAIAYPHVSFRLMHHEYEVVFTPGTGGRLDAIAAVFGREVAREMVAIEPYGGVFEVTGFLGKPSVARTTRAYELAYLNGRYIRSRIVGSAVEKAFQSLLPIARYPFVVVFITADPLQIDINVHPAKLEVRFTDEGAVFRAVFAAARRTLSASSLLLSWHKDDPLAEDGSVAAAQSATKPEVGPWAMKLPLGLDRTTQKVGNVVFIALGTALKATYLLARDDEGLLLVDQHAAHERVLYDLYVRRQEKKLQPQQLLMPVTINLSFQQARLLMERMPVFVELGFGLEAFGLNTYLLRSMPAALSRLDGARLVIDLLDELIHEPAARDVRTIRETFLTTMACHAAVRAGEILSPPEMQALLDDLAGTENPFTCPHGRPTALRLPWEEIARRFRRR